MQSGRGTGPMTPRQPIGLDPNDRCQIQLRRHSLGKNEKRKTFCSPFSHDESGLFVLPMTTNVMSEKHGYMKALKCRECGHEYPLAATHVCEFDFGPLEVAYDYDRIKKSLTRAALATRPKTMWRYRELLPVAGEPTVGTQAGYTPLIKSDRLAKKLGIRELWIKNDAVNYPTLSFKDRVVSVALSRSKELGF